MMNYESMKKDELIKIIEDQKHLASAIEEKDKEISGLKQKMTEIFEKEKTNLQNAQEQIKKTLEEELKKTKDALADNQNKMYELDRLRIEQLNEIIYIYGDLLKTLQGVTDTHIKLNTLIVKKLSGGEQ